MEHSVRNNHSADGRRERQHHPEEENSLYRITESLRVGKISKTIQSNQ